MAYKLEVYDYGAYVINDSTQEVVQYVDLFALKYDKSGTYYYEYEIAETYYLLSAKKSSKINPRDIHYEITGTTTNFFFNFDGIYNITIARPQDNELASTYVPQAAVGGASDPDHYVVVKVNNIHTTETPNIANVDIYLYILDQDETGYMFYRVVNIGNYDLPWAEVE